MSEKTTATSGRRGLRGLLAALRDWLDRKLLSRFRRPGAQAQADVLDREGEDLVDFIFFLEGRVQDLESRLGGAPLRRGPTGADTSERVEALVTTVAVLTKSVVQLSLQVQHLYDELGMDPNDPLEDIFFSAGEGLGDGEDDEPTGSGSSSGGFGGGLGGMIN